MLNKTLNIPLNISVEFLEQNILQIQNSITTLKYIYHIPESLQIKINRTKVIITQISGTNKQFYIDFYSIKKIIKQIQKQFKKRLYLVGLGFKAFLKNKILILKLGLSHDINLTIPSDISINLIDATTIICYSSNLQILTQFTQQIKNFKIPEPYKGKGIFYENEKILRKKGKREKK